MQCPACGMDNAEAAQWCDFCKEPFKKKEAPAAAPPAGPMSAPKAREKKVAVSADLLAKLAEQRQSAAAQEESGGIPAEFQGLDSGEQIPVVPPAVRKMAFFFGFLCLFWTAVAVLWLMNRAPKIGRASAGPPPAHSR